MPRKFITQDVKDQNRESQRRSRARRTEVMKDLKKQVEAFQQQGAAASLEMQKVARAVAFENQRLRSLLKIHGVSQDDIGRYIAMPSAPLSPSPANSSEPSSLRCRVCGSTSIAAEKLPAGRPCASSNISQEDSNQIQPLTFVRHQAAQNSRADKKVAMEGAPTAIALPPRSPTFHQIGDKSDQKVLRHGHQSRCHTPHVDKDKDKIHNTETYLRFGAPLSVPRRDPHCAPEKNSHTDAMETSCDTAASILVDLHHHADTERARAALGCKGPSSCTVNNIKMFQLLDSFS